MKKWRTVYQVPALLAGGAILSSILTVWSCTDPLLSKMSLEETAPSYHAIFLEVPSDDPDTLAVFQVQLGHTHKSDTPFWKDLRTAINGMKLWRVQVYRLDRVDKFSIDPIATSTSGIGYSNAWLRIADQSTIELKNLPLEVALRVDIDVCNCDDPETESAKHGEGRSLLLLLHRIPVQ